MSWTRDYKTTGKDRLANIEDGIDLVANGGSITASAPSGDTTGAADTAAIQALLTAAKTTPVEIVLQKGDYYVTNLTSDFATDTAQASSGAPYGFRGPRLRGMGRRSTRLNQVTGATGAVIRLAGKTGTSAGPSHNNKITGAAVVDLEILPASGATCHGVEVQSFTDLTLEGLWIRGGGGSGVKMLRATFDPGVNDEFAYGFAMRDCTVIAMSRYGIEHDGVNAISGVVENCSLESNTLGAAYVCPAGWRFIGGFIGGNPGGGIKSVRCSHSASSNFGLAILGTRLEGNGSGYEIDIDAGFGHSIGDGAVILASGGATAIGLGRQAAGSDSFVWYPQIGALYATGSNTSGQKFLVLGSDSRYCFVSNPRVDFSGFFSGYNKIGDTITDGGANTSVLVTPNLLFSADGYMEWQREISTPSAPSSGMVRLYAKADANSKGQLAVKFPTGGEQIIYYEGLPVSLTQSPQDYLRNGSQATYRESVQRHVASTAIAMVSGTMYLVALPLFIGDVVTSLSFFSSTALTRGTTAGTAHLWAALYDSSLGLLSQSTDQGDASVFNGFGAFTLAAAQTITTSGVYYAAIMCVAGAGGAPAQPAIRGASAGNNGLSGGVGSQKVLAATDSGSYTTTAPATTTVATPTSGIPYALVR